MNDEQREALNKVLEATKAYDSVGYTEAGKIMLQNLMDAYLFRTNEQLEQELVECYPDAAHRALVREGQAQVVLGIKNMFENSQEGINAINEVLTNVEE